MKLISRLTTALFCSAIAIGLSIPGDAETAKTDLEKQGWSSKRVFSNSEIKSDQNKQKSNLKDTNKVVDVEELALANSSG